MHLGFDSTLAPGILGTGTLVNEFLKLELEKTRATAAAIAAPPARQHLAPASQQVSRERFFRSESFSPKKVGEAKNDRNATLECLQKFITHCSSEAEANCNLLFLQFYSILFCSEVFLQIKISLVLVGN